MPLMRSVESDQLQSEPCPAAAPRRADSEPDNGLQTTERRQCRTWSWNVVDTKPADTESKRKSWSVMPTKSSQAAKDATQECKHLGRTGCVAFLSVSSLLGLLTVLGVFASRAGFPRWVQRLNRNQAQFDHRLRNLYMASDTLSGVGTLLEIYRPGHVTDPPASQDANNGQGLVKFFTPDVHKPIQDMPANLVPGIIQMRSNEQHLLLNEAEKLWYRLHGFAMQCADKGVCLLDAWAKLEAWKENRVADKRVEQERALREIGAVSTSASGLMLVAEQLTQDRLCLENEEQHLKMSYHHEEHMFDKGELLQDRRDASARMRFAFTDLGYWMDQFMTTAMRLFLCVSAACFGAYLEECTRGSVKHGGGVKWAALGLYVNKLLGSVIGFLVKTVVEALVGDVAEILGIMELFCAAAVPELFLSVLGLIGLAPLRGLFGAPAILVPGYIAALCCGSSSLFLGFFLPRVTATLYPGTELGGRWRPRASRRCTLSFFFVLIAWAVLRAHVWYQAIVL